MKRYGDNLASDQDEPENEQSKVVEVIRGGCSVRYGMLDFILNGEKQKKSKTSNIFSQFKLKHTKTKTNI